MKLRKLAAGLGIALSMFAGASQAAVLSFEDDDIDFILRGTSTTPLTSGTLAPGDVLVSVFEIPVFTTDGANSIPAGQELTGVAAVQIESIVGTTITFRPVASGLNSILALGPDPDATVGTAGNAGGGATIAMFFNSALGDDNLDVNRTSNPASNCASLADCIDEASQGNLFQVDGFTGDVDEFWIANAVVSPLVNGLDIGSVRGANNALVVASFNAAQGTFFNASGDIAEQHVATGTACPAPSGNPAVSDGCVAGFIVSGTVTGGQGLSNGAFAHSDFDGLKLQVPEPGTLALAGLALLGLGATRRQRR